MSVASSAFAVVASGERLAVKKKFPDVTLAKLPESGGFRRDDVLEDRRVLRGERVEAACHGNELEGAAAQIDRAGAQGWISAGCRALRDVEGKCAARLVIGAEARDALRRLTESVLEFVRPPETMPPLTPIPTPTAPAAAFVVIVPLLVMPAPIVLLVIEIACVAPPTAFPGVTVPSFVTAPETFALLTMIDVTVVLAGLSTLLALPVTDIPAACAGSGAPRRSAATEVVAKSAGMEENTGREASGRPGREARENFIIE